MKILAIESTCDETAAAVVENYGKGVRVIKSVVASSVEMHQKYGGIVPEVAAREQIKSIIPVIMEAVHEETIDAVAVSYGPGLMGSLLVGVETAKALAWAWNKPLLRVNHLAAHVLANWLGEEVPELPAVGLVVSGGHTDLILLESLEKWTWIGGTRDDAAGEAFDKAARILGLPYPGGPEVDKAAGKVGDEELDKSDHKYKLPRPLIHEPGLGMSFSGIKAAISRLVSKEDRLSETNRNLIAREFTEAVTDVLISKTMSAVDIYHPKSVIMAGGVAANNKLRESLKHEVEMTGVKFFVPEIKFCGDNAAMVGAAAILRPDNSQPDLKPDPGLSIV
jgi:N6-L-threonylcarbamoyladenine synthase